MGDLILLPIYLKLNLDQHQQTRYHLCRKSLKDFKKIRNFEIIFNSHFCSVYASKYNNIVLLLPWWRIFKLMICKFRSSNRYLMFSMHTYNMFFYTSMCTKICIGFSHICYRTLQQSSHTPHLSSLSIVSLFLTKLN